MTFERKIRAAEGYSELGMYSEALAELDELDGEQQDRLEALRARVEVVLRQRDWQSALRLSLRACKLHPGESAGFIHAAFCLHELGRTEEAKRRRIRQSGSGENLFACKFSIEQVVQKHGEK